MLNKCVFLARTTKDIELKNTKNGSAVTEFNIANETGYGDNKATHFFTCEAWGKQAESLQKNVPKGTKLILVCEARLNQYTDKNGNKAEKVKFRVLEWEFAESKKNSQNASDQPQGNGVPTESFMDIPSDISEELPFN